MKKIDLFGAEPLNIFEAEKLPEPVQNQNATWQALHDRELRLAVTHPPANYFQEMILWTEQGKLWKFPIDNEQGILTLVKPTKNVIQQPKFQTSAQKKTCTLQNMSSWTSI